MNKIYENKSAYDPGRFRYKVTFQQQVAIADGSGGSKINTNDLLTTFAVREAILKRPNFAGDLIVAGEADVILGDWNFVIRSRSGFFPTKDMFLVCEGITYTIRTILELDEPTKYIKVLAVKAE
jgi:hypothetical protein